MINKNFIVSLLIFGAVILGAFFYICKEDTLSQKLISQYQQEEVLKAPEVVKKEIRKYKSRPGDIKVPILTYHNIRSYSAKDTEFQKGYIVQPDAFEKQMQYLKDSNYNVISFDVFIDGLLGKFLLPEKPIVLTFDDTWENQYANALPILKKYNFTATFFIFTNAPEHKNFMTWNQIKELADLGMTIGNHSKSHPYFTITDKGLLYEEVINSKKILENKLGRTVDIFAYPFGQYNQEVVDIIKEAGYKAARTIDYGLFHSKDDLFMLRSIIAPGSLSGFIYALEN